MKLRAVCISLICIFFVVAPIGFSDEHISVIINDQPVEFQTSPMVNDGVLMVPMRELFEAMSAEVLWIGEDQTVVAYRDNMHLKLKIGDKVAFKNGKKFTMLAAPTIRESRTLIPVEVIAETFDLMTNWNEGTKTLSLSASSDIAGLKTFGREIYKTQILEDLGVVIAIPYDWNKTDTLNSFGVQNEEESYGIRIGKIEESYTDLQDFAAYNRKMLMDAHGDKIVFTGEETLSLTDNRSAQMLFLNRSTASGTIKQALSLFVESGQGFFITATYDDSMPEDELTKIFRNITTTFRIRNAMVDSDEEHYIEFKDFYDLGMTINQELYSNIVVTNSEIPFSGSVKQDSGLAALKIEITHEGEIVHYSIPVIEGDFDGKIHTPFGLGKHNVYVYGVPFTDAAADKGPLENKDNDDETQVSTPVQPNSEEPASPDSQDKPPTDEEDTGTKDIPLPSEDKETEANQPLEDPPTGDTTSPTSPESFETEEPKDPGVNEKTGAERPAETPKGESVESDHALPGQKEATYHLFLKNLMKFSLVNIDSDVTRFLIPTDQIRSGDEQISSVALLITYKDDGDYRKARSLYDWMLANMRIDSEGTGPYRSNEKVFDDQIGTPEELAQLYTAYLRAIGIPSRVVSGQKGDLTHFWNEVYLNGDWVASDVHWGLIYQDDMLDKQNGGQSYFNIAKSEQDGKFETLALLPY